MTSSGTSVIRIGTRASTLARAQSTLVAEALTRPPVARPSSC